MNTNAKFKKPLEFLFPPQCVNCGALVAETDALCGGCWRDTPFVLGLACQFCGAPLPGEEAGRPETCDDCLTIARPWEAGRAALVYRDAARTMVLALKHGDRLDLVPAAAGWLQRAAAPLIRPGQIVVPVPIHWRRRLSRRYNQAAVLTLALARRTGLRPAVQALVRQRRTAVQDGLGLSERFANQQGAIAPHPRHGAMLDGADVLLIDDVMTSGATLATAAEAARGAGAARVSVAVLARVVKDA